MTVTDGLCPTCHQWHGPPDACEINHMDLPRAARDVPSGASWAFREHRTMEEVMRDEST
jgi:hypothetical protein